MTADLLRTIANLSVVVFVLCSMLTMGLSLHISQVLSATCNRRLVLGILGANFLVVPAIALALSYLMPVRSSFSTGLLLLATGSGAPVLPKLVHIARGRLALATGLMVMLMVGTIVFLPIVLPLLIGSNISINRWDLARPLVFAMLMPLALGLLVRRWSPKAAVALGPITNQVASVTFVLGIALLIILNAERLARALRSGALPVALFFLVAAFLAGYLLASRDPDERLVAGLATAQRDISAALLLAITNFASQPDVNATVIFVGLLGLLGLTTTAGAFRMLRRQAIEPAGGNTL